MKRMIRIYRMWRFIKVVEHFNIGLRQEYADSVECCMDFQKLKTIFGHYYTVEETYTALQMAQRDEYVGSVRAILEVNVAAKVHSQP